MNTYNFTPTLFDARFHGVYTYKSVLDYHKSIENLMPQDGIVWACENAEMKILEGWKNKLITEIEKLEKAMKWQPYEVWTLIDRKAHFLKTRLQLITLRITEYNSTNK